MFQDPAAPIPLLSTPRARERAWHPNPKRSSSATKGHSVGAKLRVRCLASRGERARSSAESGARPGEAAICWPRDLPPLQVAASSSRRANGRWEKPGSAARCCLQVLLPSRFPWIATSAVIRPIALVGCSALPRITSEMARPEARALLRGALTPACSTALLSTARISGVPGFRHRGVRAAR